MSAFLALIIVGFNYFVGFYYGVVNIFYTVIFTMALFVVLNHLKRIQYSARIDYSYSPQTPPVSIVIPAYNEEEVIVRTVSSALSIHYPDFEVIVVNDGSDDGTLETLVATYHLKKVDLVYRKLIRTGNVKGFYYNREIPNLLVIDKERGNKADALNCGINASRSPYFCSLDADSVLEKESLLRLMTPIIESTEPVIACGGVVRVLNGTELSDGHVQKIDLPKKALAMFQIVEYLRAFLFGRVGLDAMNSLLILSGAFSLFEKSAVIEAGGYDLANVTEDMELIVKLHERYRRMDKPYRIKFISDPICWTEVPENLKMLSRQRRRWHLGLVETVAKYRHLSFNPKYGRIGTFVMPYYLLVELLSPLVEVLGYAAVFIAYFLGLLSLEFLLLFLTLAVFYGVFLTTSGIFLEEITYRRYPRWGHFFTLLFYGLLENFGYRQVNSLFRVQGMIRFLTGKRDWEYTLRENRNVKGGHPKTLSPGRKA